MLAHDLIYYRYPIQGKHPEPISKTGKNDILSKDRSPPSKTIPFWAARHTYLAHIWEYPPPPRGIHQVQTTVPHSVCSR